MPDDREMQPLEKADASGQSSKPQTNGDRLPVLADVLEQVISATSSDQDSSGHDVALRKKLEEVARRYPSESLTGEPVVVSLVAAVAGGIQLLTAEQKHSVDLAVAKTLYEDAGSRARLEQLWHSLGGAPA